MRMRVRSEVMPIAVAGAHLNDPVGDRADLLRVGEVDLERRDRHGAALERVEVGAGPRLARRARGPDPVHGLAARILSLHHWLRLVAPSQPRHLDAGERLVGHVRHVHVEEHGSTERRARQAFHEIVRHAACGLVVRELLAHQRDRDRRDAEQVALGGRGDGARIERVVAHVGAAVDARNDHVGLEVEEARHRHVDAIGRRPVHVVEAVVGVA